MNVNYTPYANTNNTGTVTYGDHHFPQALHSEQVQALHDIRLALPHTAKPGQERYYSADGMAGSLANLQN
ncbi:hypothetical protein QR685DRAFT_435008 [Neurospora intermedia]|uniref:Uncharacterized protein n=1 Tax=Neurospora intermedia TaxID=5142 RepID=A0ABR3DLQ3_NEUIN